MRFRHLCRVVEWWKVSPGSFSSCFCVDAGEVRVAWVPVEQINVCGGVA